jgi:DNA-binding LacI/PurR family transcriptional regulator
MNIHEIAEEAGVSIATVSRVINGKKDVSQDTRTKVMEIMQRRNFMPKFTTSASVEYIGVFVSSNKKHIHTHSAYTSLMLDGIFEAAFGRQICVAVVSSTSIPKDNSEFLHFCKQRRISGGIFLTSTQDETYIKELGKQMPLVLVGNNLGSESIGSVRSDNLSGSYEAVRYLIACGHKKILLVMADSSYIDHRERLEGAVKALDEAGMELNPYNIRNTSILSDADLAYSLGFAIENSAPDAIFVGGDHDAIRVLRILKEKGIKVPDDISVVGYDNLPVTASSQPPLTTVNQPIYKIGMEATNMLLEMIANKRNKPRNILLMENDLIIRESVKQRNCITA